jgi:hypothetical protein
VTESVATRSVEVVWHPKNWTDNKRAVKMMMILLVVMLKISSFYKMFFVVFLEKKYNFIKRMKKLSYAEEFTSMIIIVKINPVNYREVRDLLSIEN